MRDWLEKNQVPGEGLRLEVPETDDEETDPPLEDRKSTNMALWTAISWTRWQTMWPQGGSKTSST